MDIASVLKKKPKDDPTMEEIRMERAEELHSESLIIDGHQGSLWDVLNGVRNFQEESAFGHSDLPKLRQSKVDCVFLSAFPYDRVPSMRGVKQALEYIDVFNDLSEAIGIRRVLQISDIESVRDTDEVGVMLSFGDGAMLEGSLETFRMYYKLGLRMLTLTWNDRNLLADGAAVSVSRGGLTPFGIKVVNEASRLGVIVDVAHLSEAGFWDMVDLAQSPFVASHSNCYSLLSHPRNLSDAQLKAIGEAGGLVGISFNHEYLTGTDEKADIATVAEHIIHAMELAGEDCVGLGTDFDSFGEAGPEPVSHIGKLPYLTFELLKRGISGEQIAGILGRNWMRILRAVVG